MVVLACHTERIAGLDLLFARRPADRSTSRRNEMWRRGFSLA